MFDPWCSNCDVQLFMVMLVDPCGRLVSRPTPPRGLFGSVWLKGASRDLLVSGVTPVLCFGLILTRVDLVTQPVAYLVFGQSITCCCISYVLFVILDIGYYLDALRYLVIMSIFGDVLTKVDWGPL